MGGANILMKSNNKLKTCLALLFSSIASQAICQSGGKVLNQSSDIVIYGCTPAGVTAAVEARRQNKTVSLICRDKHIGGMTANGLGWADTGDHETIGGLTGQFYHDIWTYYGRRGIKTFAMQGKPRSDSIPAMYVFEPHVAEQIFEVWLKRAGIAPVRLAPISRDGLGVTKRRNHITSIKLADGRVFSGRRFIDASYEGDLMAEAGVRFAVGRESNSAFGETLNGVQTTNAIGHQFERNVDPYVIAGKPASGLLPRIEAGPAGADGSGDTRIQAYTYRLCMTKVAANRAPFTKPAQYDPKEYELLGRYLDAGWRDDFRKYNPIPRGKTDTNNYGPFSMDNIGQNYQYPTGSDAVRNRIATEHRTYQEGLLWFLQNDPRSPKDVRRAMKPWGLCADEFADNGHWPREMYIREGRRMASDFVMTERHVRGQIASPRSIGLGSYAIDSHNVRRYVDAGGHARNEGNIQVNPGRSYEISYDTIVPRLAEADNLLVPVALSASHIAYGSIRMEPVFMILGQSAAAAAAISIDKGQAVQKISYDSLRAVLISQGQVLQANYSLLDTTVKMIKGYRRISVALAVLGLLSVLASAVLIGKKWRGSWMRRPA